LAKMKLPECGIRNSRKVKRILTSKMKIIPLVVRIRFDTNLIIKAVQSSLNNYLITAHCTPGRGALDHNFYTQHRYSPGGI